MIKSDHKQRIVAHYRANWGTEAGELRLQRGPIDDLPPDFCVLKFAPTKTRTMWTYATCCMSQPADEEPIELHLFSPFESEDVLEALTAVAHYHRTGRRIGLGHTVNFGRPWISDSQCDRGFVSLPYLDGPKVEELITDGTRVVSCYWLIPITLAEVEYAKHHGIEALEQRFDQPGFNYLDPNRSSVV